MSELQMMKKQLEATGLYNVKNDSVILAELSAYAEALDICFDALHELERECFVSTAEDYGLSIRESMLARNFTGAALTQRRNAVIKAMSVCTEDYTLSGMEKVRDSFNLHGNFTFDSTNIKTVFNCTDTLSAAKRALLTKQMGEFMPFWADFEIRQS